MPKGKMSSIPICKPISHQFSSPRSSYHSTNAWTSLFIPYIETHHTREYLTHAMETKYGIGKVKYIDLVAKPTFYLKSGDGRSAADKISAFIHFEYWHDNEFTRFLRYYLNKYEKYDMSNYYRYAMNVPGKNISQSDTQPFPVSPQHNAQIDAFHILINRSTRNPHGNNSLNSISDDGIHTSNGISRSISTQSLSSVPSPDMEDILDKMNRRIELLEEEVYVLRNLWFADQKEKR